MPYKRLSIILPMIIILSFSGCSYKRDILKSQSYLITIKMKSVAFSDLGLFLSNLYKQNTLSNILNKKTIFKKSGYKKTANGFMQNIKQNSLVIKYIVSKDKIYFKDFSNHIIIKLVKMENLSKSFCNVY